MASSLAAVSDVLFSATDLFYEVNDSISSSTQIMLSVRKGFCDRDCLKKFRWHTQFGIIGSKIQACLSLAKCNVFLPPNIDAGRFRASLCVNGPTPRNG